MNRIAVFPGSFDPVTAGHYDLIQRAMGLFDRVIVAIGQNADKQSYFDTETRLRMIRELFAGNDRVEAVVYSGLTIEYCRQRGAGYLIRGLRTSADFEFERAIAQANRQMMPEIETVFLLTSPSHAHISSSIVREVLRYGGDPSVFLPDGMNWRKYLPKKSV